jgi:hypothetical protein
MVASDQIHSFGKSQQYRRLGVSQFLVLDGDKGKGKGHPRTGDEGTERE